MELNDTPINELQSVGIQVPTRAEIVGLQEALAVAPVRCVLPEPVHRFAPGMYMRELIVPAGMLIVGKIHRYDHFLMVMSGRALVISEFGNQVVTAGHISVSKAGVKRVVYGLEDTRFITLHTNKEDTQDLEAIESHHIEPEQLPDWPGLEELK